MKLYDVYSLFNVIPVYGKGTYVYDDQNKTYLDFYGGHAVISIGHSHPHYIQRISDQLNKLGFYSNSIINSLQEELAEKLGVIAGLPAFDLFLVNSGAEANENALKLASFHNGRKKILALKNSFHGRTSAAINISYTGQKHQSNINKGIKVNYLSMQDTDGISREILTGQYSCVILEAIQGIGGLDEVSPELLQIIRHCCGQSDTVMIMDEIQCGYGRSGQFFAFEVGEIIPDIVTTAKGMGNGFPVGGVLIDRDKFPAVKGRLGTTFGGNHLACAAALAVLEVIEDENLLENASLQGALLRQVLSGLDGIKNVKGRGLMIGAEFDFNISSFRAKLAHEYGLFTGSSSNPNLLRILPPLNVSGEEISQFEEIMHRALKNHLSEIQL